MMLSEPEQVTSKSLMQPCLSCHCQALFERALLMLKER
jgi:hypothetical protein